MALGGVGGIGARIAYDVSRSARRASSAFPLLGTFAIPGATPK